jgi:hypothetical protein
MFHNLNPFLNIRNKTVCATSLCSFYTFRPAGGKEGQFRILLSGTDHINVSIPATSILPIPEMEMYTIVGQFKPGTQACLRKNSACSAWVDVGDLVASQDVDIHNPDGQDTHEAFLETLADVKATLATAGLSWRWMLVASADAKGVELQLQGMPCSAAAIESIPILNKDNVAAAVLAR